jgi:ribosomal protein S27E
MTKVRCKNCNKIFYRPNGRFNEAIKFGWNQFCSSKCLYKFKIKRIILKCENCGKKIIRTPNTVSPHNYCSHSCAAKIVNKNWAERGGKRIKCEGCRKIFKQWRIGSNKKYCSKKCQTETSLYTKEKLLKIINDVAKKLKRTPTRREFWGGVDKACVRLFGSWNKAVSATGLTPNRSHDDRMYKRIISKSIDGHLCDSVSEVLIDNWLYENKILHDKNIPYPSTHHKADWKLLSKNKQVFVEYFGLANDSPRYDRSIKEKEVLCKKENICLIAIYPKDLYPKIYLDNNLRNKFKDYLID